MAHASFRYVYMRTLTRVPSVSTDARICSFDLSNDQDTGPAEIFAKSRWISITVLRMKRTRNGESHGYDNAEKYKSGHFYSAFIGIRVAFLAHVNRQRNCIFFEVHIRVGRYNAR